MNLVDGATTFPVLVGNDASLTRSEDTVRRMEAVGWGDLAAVVARNLAMTRSLRAVDALLLVLRVWEVQNFECVIIMTFWYVFWNGLTFFELFKLLFFTWD